MFKGDDDVTVRGGETTHLGDLKHIPTQIPLQDPNLKDATMKLNRKLAAAALAASITLAGCAMGASSDDESITLRYAYFAPENSFPGVQMQEWKDQIEERTDGKVDVELFAGGTLLTLGDIYDGVSSGVAEVGLDTPAADQSRFPFSSVTSLPVGAKTSAAASKAFLALLLEYEPKEFDDYEIITAFTTEPAYLQTQNPIRSVADGKGMEIRGSAALAPTLRRLGITSINLGMAEVAQSLQTSVITGYASSREVMEDFGLAEQISYVTNYPLGTSSNLVAVMDKSEFEGLPDDVKKIIEDLREEMTDFASAYHDGENISSALAFAKENDVENIEVTDPAEWDKAMADTNAAWVDQFKDADFDAAEVLDRYRELVAEFEQSAE